MYQEELKFKPSEKLQKSSFTIKILCFKLTILKIENKQSWWFLQENISKLQEQENILVRGTQNYLV